MSKYNYSVDKINVFVLNNLTLEQTSLITNLNSFNNDVTKINFIDVNLYLLSNGLYNLYILVGVMNNTELTNVMEEQFITNIKLMNLSYNVKKAIIIGNIDKIITSQFSWKKNIKESLEKIVKLEILVGSVGTKNDPTEKIILLIPQDPSKIDLLFNHVVNLDNLIFEEISSIKFKNINL